MFYQLKILLGRWRLAFNRIILRRLGFELVKNEHSSPLSLTQLIDWSLQSLDTVTCLQIGAHDGVKGDHLVQLRTRPHWRNWLLEPEPGTFRTLQANTCHLPNTVCLPLALVPSIESGEVPLYKVNLERIGLKFPPQHIASQLSSLRRDKLETELAEFAGITETPPDWIHSSPVPSIDWISLIEQSSKVSPDLILLDTEGLDGQLIHAFPFDRWRPRVIVFENMWLNDHDFNHTCALLESLDYQIITIQFDSIAIQRDLLDQNTKLARQGINTL